MLRGFFNTPKHDMNVNNLYLISIGTNTYEIIIHKKNLVPREGNYVNLKQTKALNAFRQLKHYTN